MMLVPEKRHSLQRDRVLLRKTVSKRHKTKSSFSGPSKNVDYVLNRIGFMSFKVHSLSRVEDGLVGSNGRIRFYTLITSVITMVRIVPGPKQVLRKYLLNERINKLFLRSLVSFVSSHPCS